MALPAVIKRWLVLSDGLRWPPSGGLTSGFVTTRRPPRELHMTPLYQRKLSEKSRYGLKAAIGGFEREKFEGKLLEREELDLVANNDSSSFTVVQGLILG